MMLIQFELKIQVLDVCVCVWGLQCLQAAPKTSPWCLSTPKKQQKRENVCTYPYNICIYINMYLYLSIYVLIHLHIDIMNYIIYYIWLSTILPHLDVLDSQADTYSCHWIPRLSVGFRHDPLLEKRVQHMGWMSWDIFWRHTLWYHK